MEGEYFFSEDWGKILEKTLLRVNLREFNLDIVKKNHKFDKNFDENGVEHLTSSGNKSRQSVFSRAEIFISALQINESSNCQKVKKDGR